MILPFSIISKPIDSIEAFLDTNFDLSKLDATNSFLLKITLFPYNLNLLDLKITFSSNSILSVVKKFPSLAVINIFCFLLFIENLGLVISANWLFFIKTTELVWLDLKYTIDNKKIIRKKTINEKIKKNFLFNDKRIFNLIAKS